MAPELRTRKAKADPAKTATVKEVSSRKVKSTVPATKRKAAEDTSPVSKKKSKSTVGVKQKSLKEDKEPKLLEPVEDASDADSDEEDDHVQALVNAMDSGDEEDVPVNSVVVFKEGQDVGEAPQPSDALSKARKSNKEETGVIYVGHIPHGFYEREMSAYFSQFGSIERLRLSRNRRTGNSKGYAFLEFADKSTAEIVAKTMDNYLLFGHVLKCKVIQPSQLHDSLWKGANKRFKKVPWNKMEGKKLEKPLTESNWVNRISTEEKRRQKRAEKLASLGYDFEGPKLKSVGSVQQEPPAAVEAGNEKALKAIETTQPSEEGIDTQDVVKEPAPKAKQNGTKATKKADPAGEKKGKTPKSRKAKS